MSGMVSAIPLSHYKKLSYKKLQVILQFHLFSCCLGIEVQGKEAIVIGRSKIVVSIMFHDLT